jgi:hypothetical protein
MSETMSEPTFIQLVLSGRALLTDIDEYVDKWHKLPSSDPRAELEIYEFLGMSWEDYRLWVEQPEALRFIIAARRAQLPVEKVLEQTKIVGAAARSQEHSEAAHVLRWLADRGRIGTS